MRKAQNGRVDGFSCHQRRACSSSARLDSLALSSNTLLITFQSATNHAATCLFVVVVVVGHQNKLDINSSCPSAPGLFIHPQPPRSRCTSTLQHYDVINFYPVHSSGISSRCQKQQSPKDEMFKGRRSADAPGTRSSLLLLLNPTIVLICN